MAPSMALFVAARDYEGRETKQKLSGVRPSDDTTVDV